MYENHLSYRETAIHFNLDSHQIISKWHNPSINITVQDVARDLQVGENMAYEIFKRNDFPSVNIGYKWKISLIDYLNMKNTKKFYQINCKGGFYY